MRNISPIANINLFPSVINSGVGIRRIFKLYENCPVQPSIEATTNAFRIVLPNMNMMTCAIKFR